MTYLEANERVLRRRHYVVLASVGSHWFSFYANRVEDYRGEFGKEFCLVINCSKNRDDAYVMPFEEVEGFFAKDYLSKGRWAGTVSEDRLAVYRYPEPPQESVVSRFHNAFDLLQDAPGLVPGRVEYE